MISAPHLCLNASTLIHILADTVQVFYCMTELVHNLDSMTACQSEPMDEALGQLELLLGAKSGAHG